ncbi:MAG: DJ-1/PfpI family protein [Candidatus Phytoplasma stylosanthis]|uniref:DJ-1/PfpI family protein n=1 Tax=Candidatus Phytoplasma stylosanthis TaxID=2798314 RepID=UPI00293AFCED|nr:DJ-1/PfpI family protein [Candidatus Phytoplasma stylosanthis]MDV3170816.1 DJ-1/PfpI family protein [Candidatus Phytoplasma stylosanthis]MDV3174170.1 DJ-1/PfpI family protein [Candidatus Phytoplasma stylosanthis]MDV3202539.1 DJ-1/PfpI family protein [Candidatus Phytoplasma stylosanthis]
MKKGLLLLLNGFEDTEALSTRAFLKKNFLDITTFTTDISLKVFSSQNLIVQADLHIDRIDDLFLSDYDFLIIPGGPYVKKILNEKPFYLNKIYEIIKYFSQNKKVIGAICAAPAFLGQLNLLQNHSFTCYPGCESYIKGNYLPNERAVTSDFFITSRSPETIFEFVDHLLKKLKK